MCSVAAINYSCLFLRKKNPNRSDESRALFFVVFLEDKNHFQLEVDVTSELWAKSEPRVRKLHDQNQSKQRLKLYQAWLFVYLAASHVGRKKLFRFNWNCHPVSLIDPQLLVRERSWFVNRTDKIRLIASEPVAHRLRPIGESYHVTNRGDVLLDEKLFSSEFSFRAISFRISWLDFERRDNSCSSDISSRCRLQTAFSQRSLLNHGKLLTRSHVDSSSRSRCASWIAGRLLRWTATDLRHA